MQWIDAHVHIGEDMDGVSATEADIDDLFADGYIDQAVVFCFDEENGLGYGNRRTREMVSDDERMVGLFRVDPHEHTVDDLGQAIEDGFAGFKLHPRSQDFSMQHVYEHMQAIGDLDVPVLIHTGVGDDPSTGFSRAHPEEILEAADIHRGTDVILAHNTKGYYFHAPDAFQDTLQALDNVYIDISLHCTPLGVETLVNDLGAQKILFASDYPYGHPVPMQENVRHADISEEAMQRIAWQNADDLFFS